MPALHCVTMYWKNMHYDWTYAPSSSKASWTTHLAERSSSIPFAKCFCLDIAGIMTSSIEDNGIIGIRSRFVMKQTQSRPKRVEWYCYHDHNFEPIESEHHSHVLLIRPESDSVPDSRGLGCTAATQQHMMLYTRELENESRRPIPGPIQCLGVG